MGPGGEGPSRRLAIALMLMLWLCTACARGATLPASTTPTLTETPTRAPTETPTQVPIPTATPTRRPTTTPPVVESPWIDLITPITGDTVTAPIRFEGRVNRVTEARRVTVHLFNAAGETLAETTVVVMGEIGQPGNFSGQINVEDYEGEARLTVMQDATGATNATRLTIKSQSP